LYVTFNVALSVEIFPITDDEVMSQAHDAPSVEPWKKLLWSLPQHRLQGKINIRAAAGEMETTI
jgi:hypothetical protein